MALDGVVIKRKNLFHEQGFKIMNFRCCHSYLDFSPFSNSLFSIFLRLLKTKQKNAEFFCLFF